MSIGDLRVYTLNDLFYFFIFCKTVKISNFQRTRRRQASHVGPRLETRVFSLSVLLVVSGNVPLFVVFGSNSMRIPPSLVFRVKVTSALLFSGLILHQLSLRTSAEIIPFAALMNRASGLVLLRLSSFSFDAPPFQSALTFGGWFPNCPACYSLLSLFAFFLTTEGYMDEVSFRGIVLFSFFCDELSGVRLAFTVPKQEI